MRDFIRSNLFLMIVVAAVVIVGGLLIGIGASISGSVDDLIAKRTKTNQEADTVMSPAQMVNEAIVADQTQRNQAVQAEAQDVRAELAKQAENYPVLEIARPDDGSWRAFPYDRQAYDDARLTLKFTELYARMWRNAEGGWLERLGSIIPPAEDDPYLLERVRAWQEKLLERKLTGLAYVTTVMLNTQIKLDEWLKELKVEADAEAAEARAELPMEAEGGLPGAVPLPGRPGTGTGAAAAAPTALQRMNEVGRLYNEATAILDTRIPSAVQQVREALGGLQRLKQLRAELADPNTPEDRRQRLPLIINALSENTTKAIQGAESAENELKGGITKLFDIKLDEAEREAEIVVGRTGPEGRWIDAEAGTGPQKIINIDKRFEQEKNQAEVYVRREIKVADAPQYARPEAIRERAKSGGLYATPANLDVIYTEGQMGATAAELWEMQVNAWVMEDVLQAIHDTNEEVLAALPPARRNVLHSPVKRIVRIAVDRKYHLPKPGTGITTQRPYYPEMEGMPPGVPRMPGLRPQAPGGETLTGHVCTKEYDVVLYSFTVTMPQRHVLRLADHLLKGRLHTILSMEMAPAGTQTPGAEGRRTAPRGERPIELEYYYGAEPVLDVTIHGELLLWAEWARDLMPPEAIVEQFRENTEPLREEDLERAPELQASPMGVAPRR
jgi:hypothetical protein